MRRLSLLLPLALVAGCAAPEPVDVDGFATWKELRAEVAKPAAPFEVPARVAQGAAREEPVTLRYTWERGKRWTVDAQVAFNAELGGAAAVDDKRKQTGSSRTTYDATHRYLFEVEDVDDQGRARIKRTLQAIRIELLPPPEDGPDADVVALLPDEMREQLEEQSKPKVKVLDPVKETTTGDLEIDVRANQLDQPVVLEVSPRGEVVAIEGGKNLRNRVLVDALDEKQRKKLAKEFSDEKLLANAQQQFLVLPEQELTPGATWTSDVRAANAGRSGSQRVTETCAYLGTVRTEGQDCAKVFAHRVIPGEDEVDEEGTLSVVGPAEFERVLYLRLADGLVAKCDPVEVDTQILVGVSDEIAGKDVLISIATRIRIRTEFAITE